MSQAKVPGASVAGAQGDQPTASGLWPGEVLPQAQAADQGDAAAERQEAVAQVRAIPGKGCEGGTSAVGTGAWSSRRLEGSQRQTAGQKTAWACRRADDLLKKEGRGLD